MLFHPLYGHGRVAARLDDRAWRRALLDVEAALAETLAQRGEIPADAAAAIVAACGDEARFALTTLADSVAEHATPVVGLVDVLRAAVPEPARPHVHAGATSQDIIDTALMLLVARGLAPLLEDLDAAGDAAAGLTDAHRRTPMIARTLLQQALPTTFGLVAAGWLDGLTQARGHLDHVRDAELAVQLGGPVGGRAPGVADALAARLGLAAATLPWATIRVRPALTAGVLGALSGVLGKLARDVTLLASTEVGELAEGGPGGGSSAMAHKHNPVAAVSALACVTRTPGLVATMLSAMPQEHQRAAGAWQAEWGTLTELLALTGSATAWVRELLAGLTVDAGRMAANLGAAVSADVPPPDGVDALIDRSLAAWERR